MCVFFFLTLIIWGITLQSSDFIWGINFMPIFSFSLHSSSPTFKLLSMASYGGGLLLDTSSPWSSVINHVSSFSILSSFIFKKQRTTLMKKIQGLQAPHGATSTSSTNNTICWSNTTTTIFTTTYATDGFPLRLFFVPLFLHTNIFKGNPVYRKGHRIVKYLKIKTNEFEYRTQGTNVSLN